MSPTSDKTSRSHNKIPNDQPEQGPAIDVRGWETSNANIGPNNGDILYPHVRYGFIDDSGFSQKGLVPLNDPIPEAATFVSTGIYFLTAEEKRQAEKWKPPKEIQNKCENAGRVAYSVVAESDAIEDGKSVQTIIGWLISLTTKLGIEDSEYRLFFSGNRSIHLHTDYFIRHQDLDRLKDEVKNINKSEGAELDLSIYNTKKPFRLTGAKHRKSDLHKVQIPDDANRPDVVSEATSTNNRSLFYSLPEEMNNCLVAEDDNRNSLPDEFEHQLLSRYIKGTPGGRNEDENEDPFESFDGSYNNHCFSPYSNTENGERSICVFEPRGGAYYCRDDDCIYLPSYIYAARGADGSFVMRQRKAPILISKKDYKKKDYQTGKTLVIIGGQSRSSRTFSVSNEDQEFIVDLLSFPDEIDKRQLIFKDLKAKGYSVGESGMNGELSEYNSASDYDIQRLKNDLISSDRTPTRDEAFSISCSLLRTKGWKQAWEWNKKAWGDQFSAEITEDQLQAIIDYDDDYEINI